MKSKKSSKKVAWIFLEILPRIQKVAQYWIEESSKDKRNHRLFSKNEICVNFTAIIGGPQYILKI